MELFHAYALDRLQVVNESRNTPDVYRRVRGTVIVWAGTGSDLIGVASSGLKADARYHTAYVDFSDAVDPARTESYWVTVGFQLENGNAGGLTWNISIFALDDASPLASPAAAFGVSNNQPCYVEIAWNPITKMGRMYANGTKIAEVANCDPVRKYARIMWGYGATVWYNYKSIYVGRFEGNEEPRLRRWSATTLVPNTNELGSAVNLTDGTVASVDATPKRLTYTIPANTHGLVVQSTMNSPQNASDLSVTTTDGTQTKTVRSSKASNILDVAEGALGHSVLVGALTPTPGATSLTVDVKALDRA